jgi:nucleotide-binding universal stress UspA family protein
MKSIVAPVNFTDCSTNAAYYAADMALAMEADLHLLHVLQMPVAPAEVPVGYFFNEMQKDADEFLEKLSDDLRKRTRGQIAVNVQVEVGSVEFKLEAFCERIKPFVVIMGAPGEPIDRIFSGSDAVHAVRHLPYPLLVVPPDAVFHAIRKIAIAAELSDILEAMPVSLDFLKALKEIFSAHFDVINVATEISAEQDQAVFDLYQWRRSLQEVYPELHFVKADTVEEGVKQYLAGHEADWLMIFPRRHGLLEFHKSHSKKIVMHCPVPVMSLCEHSPKKTGTDPALAV